MATEQERARLASAVTSGRGSGPDPAGPLVWVLSASTRASLRAQAGRLGDYAALASMADLAAAGHELSRPAALEHRAAVVAGDRDELLAGLAALTGGTTRAGVTEGVAADDVRPVFVFPDHGSQWAGMAADLLDTNEVYWEWMCRCDGAFADHIDWSVMDVLRQEDGAPELHRADVVQPVLFAVMVCLAALWSSVGVEPYGVVGHSRGEVAAACVAGALSLEDGAKIVALGSKAPRDGPRDGLLESLRGITPEATGVVFSSSMAGAIIATTELSTRYWYWYDNLHQPVHFDAAVTAFAGSGTPLFIEVSPHPVLCGEVADILRGAHIAGMATGTLRRGAGDWRTVVTAATRAHVLGAPVDLSTILDQPGRYVDRPADAFDRHRFWQAAGGRPVSGKA